MYLLCNNPIKTQEDYKAISQNVMHTTTGITDQFYSNIDEDTLKGESIYCFLFLI